MTHDYGDINGISTLSGTRAFFQWKALQRKGCYLHIGDTTEAPEFENIWVQALVSLYFSPSFCFDPGSDQSKLISMKPICPLWDDSVILSSLATSKLSQPVVLLLTDEDWKHRQDTWLLREESRCFSYLCALLSGNLTLFFARRPTTSAGPKYLFFGFGGTKKTFNLVLIIIVTWFMKVFFLFMKRRRGYFDRSLLEPLPFKRFSLTSHRKFGGSWGGEGFKCRLFLLTCWRPRGGEWCNSEPRYAPPSGWCDTQGRNYNYNLSGTHGSHFLSSTIYSFI